jgi:DNA-binding response OmpR family regulator
MILKSHKITCIKQGDPLLTAANGKEGADLLRANTNEIDLMITDQHMPYFSGLELVHLVRNELGMVFPIIMLTRVNLEEIKNLAFSLGVNEYMTKPFFPRQLLFKMKCMLNNH